MITAARASEIAKSLKQRENDSGLQACEDKIVETANAGSFATRIELPSQTVRNYCALALKASKFEVLDNGNELLINWEKA